MITIINKYQYADHLTNCENLDVMLEDGCRRPIDNAIGDVFKKEYVQVKMDISALLNYWRDNNVVPIFNQIAQYNKVFYNNNNFCLINMQCNID